MAIEADVSGLDLTWSAVAGRRYTVERAEDVGGPYTPVADEMEADAGTESVQLEPSGEPSTKAFYRIRVRSYVP